MKNKKNIIISILAIIVIIGIYLYNDYTKIIENVTNYSTDKKFAYSLKNEGNEVRFTLYQQYEPQVKNIAIYKIENNKVSAISYEQHYTNKLNALNSSKQEMINTTNIRVQDNIVYYEPVYSADIGISKDELINKLNDYEKIYIKVDEK